MCLCVGSHTDARRLDSNQCQCAKFTVMDTKQRMHRHWLGPWPCSPPVVSSLYLLSILFVSMFEPSVPQSGPTATNKSIGPPVLGVSSWPPSKHQLDHPYLPIPSVHVKSIQLTEFKRPVFNAKSFQPAVHSNSHHRHHKRGMNAYNAGSTCFDNLVDSEAQVVEIER